MPLSKRPLELEPDPRSVRDARAWVGELLTSLGRDDLVDSAQLGVSELVTNAVLHAEPPITVSVRGTREHPRVEVHDSSDRPPAINMRMAEDDFLLSTYGRGLGILAWYSSRWGADLTGEGKTVWFEPVVEPHPDDEVPGDVFDLDEVVARRVAGNGEPAEMLPIRLLDVPVRLWADYRRRYGELTRELRLLSLAHGADYPVAYELTQLALEVEQQRRQTKGFEVLDEAVAGGRERVDLEIWVPSTFPAVMGRMLELLEQANEFCRQERMLAVAATPQQLALQRWFFTEFARQAAGEEPLPWDGGLDVVSAER